MAAEPITADVIVPCGSTAAELERCLLALGQQEVDFDYGVIVVDSFRNPELAQCTEHFDFVRLLHASDSHLSAGSARNLGADDCKARYIAFCDADCAPETGWLAAAVNTLEQGKVIVTGPVSDLVKRPVAIADNMLQFVDFAENRPHGTISHAPGCSVALRRADFLKSGGFPKQLGEDVLFSNKISSRHGVAVFFDPDMRQRHAGRSSIGAMIGHHRSFGIARGEFGLLPSRSHERFGSYRSMVPVFALRRFGYLVLRTAQFNPLRLLLVAALTPLILLGLIAWALGFREGCWKRSDNKAL